MVLLDILRCPDCEAAFSQPDETKLVCTGCGREYPVIDGIYSLLPSKTLTDTRRINNENYDAWMDIYAEFLHDYIESGNRIYNAIHRSSHRAAKKLTKGLDNSGWGLDIGCGVGAHYPYYADPSQVVGLDTNLDSLKMIREKYPEAILVHGDMYVMPFRPGAFDHAVGIYNLEHAYFLECAIEQVLRVLAPKGHFVVGLPAEGGIAWGLGRRLTSRRYVTKKYGIDYVKIIEIEHCNTAGRVLTALKKRFEISRRLLFPFPFIPSLNLNLTVTVVCRKKRRDRRLPF